MRYKSGSDNLDFKLKKTFSPLKRNINFISHSDEGQLIACGGERPTKSTQDRIC